MQDGFGEQRMETMEELSLIEDQLKMLNAKRELIVKQKRASVLNQIVSSMKSMSISIAEIIEIAPDLAPKKGRGTGAREKKEGFVNYTSSTGLSKLFNGVGMIPEAIRKHYEKNKSLKDLVIENATEEQLEAVVALEAKLKADIEKKAVPAPKK